MISIQRPHLDFLISHFYPGADLSFLVNRHNAASLPDKLLIHLMLHQDVSHSSEPALQTERMLSESLCRCTVVSPLTRLPLTWRLFWHRLVMAWDVSCLLTRLPYLHRDFIIASIHYQFVFSSRCIPPQREALLPFCCLCIHFIYWYGASGAYYS